MEFNMENLPQTPNHEFQTEAERLKQAVIELNARELLAQGLLLTWSYNEHKKVITLYVPDDSETEYPAALAGVVTETVRLPRPLAS